jgi:UDP:flavonoid glycosyltransferase YjiC (YdhE family)
MSTFLFSAQPARGHLNPMLTIAHQLRSEEYTLNLFPETGGSAFSCGCGHQSWR